jgi:3-hydroxyanthranilate 3,4-dioxygenase
MDRRRMLHGFKAAQEVGNYSEIPVLLANVDPQVHLSRNSVPQPFHLVCEKDTVLVQLSGEAVLELRDSSVNRFALRAGDHVYVPGGTPHRVVPRSESVQIRYRAKEAGLEGVAWFCDGCGTELSRVEWSTRETVSQRAYLDSCTAFNADVERRRCSSCAGIHAEIDLSHFSTWAATAEQLHGELHATATLTTA